MKIVPNYQPLFEWLCSIGWSIDAAQNMIDVLRLSAKTRCT